MIEQTHNIDLINSILADPGIWSDIAPVGVEPFETPYYPDMLYFLVNTTDGVVIYHPYRDGLKIHPNIIPKKRGKKSYEGIEATIRAVFDMDYIAIYAEIDRDLRHITWLARQLKFSLLEVGDRDLYVRRRLNS